MFKTNQYLFVLLVLFSVRSAAQAPEIVWEQLYGGNGDDRPRQIISTPDSGLITIGHSNSIDGDKSVSMGLIDYWVVKTDTNGNILWEKSYGGSSYDYGNSICLAHEGGYMLAGYSSSTDGHISSPKGGNDYWIIKIDEDGNIEWEKSFGGVESDLAKFIIPSQDGGYVILGDSKSSGGMVSGHHGSVDESDFWIIKIDIDGNILWENSFGSTEDENADEIIQLSTTELIAVGVSSGNDGDVLDNNGGADGWVIKLDEDGNLIWTNNYGGTQSEFDLSITKDSSNNLFIAGSTQSSNIIVPENYGSYDIFVISINGDGIILWSKNFGGSGADNYVKIRNRGSNEFILSSYSTSDDYDVLLNYGGADFWLFAIDSMGQIKWNKTIGGSNEDVVRSLLITNRIFISGYTNSNDFDVTPEPSYGLFNFWNLKLDNCNQKYFGDTDGDGFGDVTDDSTACNIPIGYVSDSTDCNDLNPDIHPTLLDICNNIDDNCNGLFDEDATFITYYLDSDDDLFGAAGTDSISCSLVVGYVENNLDCNDLNAEINPLINETCNGIDDNCNIEIDEGLTLYTLFADVDGDTYGNPDAGIDTCLETVFGYVSNNLDCNDTLATIYLGATELCNYLDDDCDGLADENLSYILSYQDNDADNFGNLLIDSLSCELPTGYVLDNTDCDDTNPDIYPGATELLNGLDDDCDQVADEGLSIEIIKEIICSISPNPSFDVINITSNILGIGEFEIVSSIGQILFIGEWDANNNSISIIKLPAGVYIIRLSFNDTAVSLPFIKIN